MSNTQMYAECTPYWVLPPAERERLQNEQAALREGPSSAPWIERANREARLGEIARLLNTDARGREQIERRTSQQRQAQPSTTRDKRTKRVIRGRSLYGGEIRMVCDHEPSLPQQVQTLHHDVAALKTRLERAGFVVRNVSEPQYMEPVPYWK